LDAVVSRGNKAIHNVFELDGRNPGIVEVKLVRRNPFNPTLPWEHGGVKINDGVFSLAVVLLARKVSRCPFE
jgi:hypothetical protein